MPRTRTQSHSGHTRSCPSSQPSYPKHTLGNPFPWQIGAERRLGVPSREGNAWAASGVGGTRGRGRRAGKLRTGHGGRRSSPSAVSHHHLHLRRQYPSHARFPLLSPYSSLYLWPGLPPGWCSRPREEEMARNRAERDGIRPDVRAVGEHVGHSRPKATRPGNSKQ